MMRSIITTLLFLAVIIAKSQTIGDSLHAIHYNISLEEVNTTEKTIVGSTTVLLSPVANAVSGIALELINLTVDGVFVEGESSSFSHVDGIIVIGLSNGLLFGDTIAVKVEYHGQPFHESWGGFHYSGDYAFNLGVGFVSIPHNLGKSWFPCIDDFTDRARYDLFATVDNSKKAIGGGVLIDAIDNGDGTTTWHWRLEQNIPTYLESVSIGEYVLTSDTYYGIEDTIPIEIYTRPQNLPQVEGTFINLKEITMFFEEHFGPYPFDRIGFTATSLGAMEHATNISYPHSGINGNTSSEWWYTHELSHMWFGDMVTCSTAEDMWLNEGWATFCQIFYLEGLYSMEEYKTTMRDKHKEVLLETHIVDNGFYALNNIPQEYTYGSTAYDKGAVVTNALRTYLSDSIFYEAVTASLQNFAFQSISSYEFRDFLSEHTGINMDGFFENWVFTPGTPHYSIDSTLITENGTQSSIDIYLKQKHRASEYLGDDNIVQIAYLKDNFDMVFDTVKFSGESSHSQKNLDFIPIEILVDPEERMMDATIDNYMVLTEAEDYIFPETYFKVIIEGIEENTFIQATHNLVAPDELIEEVVGLTLSDARYWSINGYLPESFDASGRFYYDNNNKLDGDLINSENDSVVILYRENTSQDWHFVPQSRMGIWSVGFIFVDELKKGDYTLAVIDLTVSEEEIPTSTNYKVYPNPSKGKIKIEMKEEGNYYLQLVDSKGGLVDSLNFSGNRKKWNPLSSSLNAGTYMLYLYQDMKLMGVEKLIFID